MRGWWSSMGCRMPSGITRRCRNRSRRTTSWRSSLWSIWPSEWRRLFDNAAFALGDEVGQVSDLVAEFAGGDLCADGGQRFAGVQLGVLQDTIGGAELLELLGGEAL